MVCNSFFSCCEKRLACLENETECCDDRGGLERMIGFITKQETLDEAVMLLMAAFNNDTSTIYSSDSAEGTVLRDINNTTSCGGHWDCAAARIVWLMPGVFEKETKRANCGNKGLQNVLNSTMPGGGIIKVQPIHVLVKLRCAHAAEMKALLIQKNSPGKNVLSRDNKHKCSASSPHSDPLISSNDKESYQVCSQYSH